MFFYIFHHINQNLRKDNESEGSVNTRTLIFGGMCYIILHAIISTPGNSMYFYKDYIWYMFLLDICAMGVIYKSYFGRSILKELNFEENDDYDEKNHKYKSKMKKLEEKTEIQNIKVNQEKENIVENDDVLKKEIEN